MQQLYDVMRVVAAVAAIWLIIASPYVLVLGLQHWSMRARIAGAALVCVGLAAAYLTTLGDSPGAPWRLAIIAAGVVVQAVGATAYVVHLRRRRDTTEQASVRTVDPLAQVPAAVIIADRNSRILTVAGNTEAVIGWTPGELRGRPLATLIPSRYVSKHLAGIDRFNTTGEITVAGQLLPLHAVGKDHDERPITLNVQPIAGCRFIGVIQPREP